MRPTTVFIDLICTIVLIHYGLNSLTVSTVLLLVQSMRCVQLTVYSVTISNVYYKFKAQSFIIVKVNLSFGVCAFLV